MKYFKTTSTKAYTFNGKTIPNNSTTKWLILDDGAAAKLTSSPVIKSLIRAGDIIVTDKEPTELAHAPETLISTNARLKMQVTELEQKLAAAEAKTSTKKVKELQAQLTNLQAEYDKLKAEAVAELQEMKAQLDALKGVSEPEESATSDAVTGDDAMAPSSEVEGAEE